MKLPIFFIFFSIVTVVRSNLGFDSEKQTSTIFASLFKCMKDNGYDFFVGRTYKGNGEVDYKGVQNIRNALAAGLRNIDAYLIPCMTSNCPSADKQVTLAINATKGTEFGTLWLNIELFQTWPADKFFNRQFILDMINAASKMRHSVGIFTTSNSWESVVGDWNGASEHPLWWLDYGGEPNFNNFTSFGGWERPQVRKFNANLKGPCDVGLIDVNYYD